MRLRAPSTPRPVVAAAPRTTARQPDKNQAHWPLRLGLLHCNYLQGATTPLQTERPAGLISSGGSCSGDGSGSGDGMRARQLPGKASKRRCAWTFTDCQVDRDVAHEWVPAECSCHPVCSGSAATRVALLGPHGGCLSAADAGQHLPTLAAAPSSCSRGASSGGKQYPSRQSRCLVNRPCVQLRARSCGAARTVSGSCAVPTAGHGRHAAMPGYMRSWHEANNVVWNGQGRRSHCAHGARRRRCGGGWGCWGARPSTFFSDRRPAPEFGQARGAAARGCCSACARMPRAPSTHPPPTGADCRSVHSPAPTNTPPLLSRTQELGQRPSVPAASFPASAR